jgi:hypothetical protein
MLFSMTPVLIVEEIEPCLSFWIDRLGFCSVVEVPHGKKLGFIRLSRGTLNVMYQTVGHLRADLPPEATFDRKPTHTVLYVRVKNVDETVEKLKGFPVVLAKRQTDYGAIEVFYREPGGNIIGFSEIHPVR